MKPVFVGIDPSYTGFAMVCLGISGTVIDKLTIATEKKKWPHHMERLEHHRQGMLDFVRRADPMLIGIEGYSYGSKQGRELMGELGGTARLTLWSEGYGFIDIQPGTLKSYVSGKGNAPKSEMMRDVFRKWEYVADDDDDADAYAIGRFVIDFSSPEKWTKVFTKLAGKVEVVKPFVAPMRKKKVVG